MNSVYEKLAFSATAARASAYSPYSGVTVGAALLCGSGNMYLGSNIENASFSLTECAERVALFKAISEGERDFVAIAIAGGKSGDEITGAFPPCGACRQVLAEFCKPDFKIILVCGDNFTVHELSELLPHGFDKEFL